MKYSEFAINQTHDRLIELAMKAQTPNRLGGLLLESAESIAQLQGELLAARSELIAIKNIIETLRTEEPPSADKLSNALEALVQKYGRTTCT